VSRFQTSDAGKSSLTLLSLHNASCTSDTEGCTSDTGGSDQVRLGWIGCRLGGQRIERERNGEHDGRRDAAAQMEVSTMMHCVLREESIAEAWRAQCRAAIGRAPERA
jgi:hypothetical protein